MTSKISKYSLSHIIIRSIAIFNVASFLLELWLNIMTNLGYPRSIEKWWIYSSLFLPLYVVLEAYWLRKEGVDKKKEERMGVIVDVVFAVAPLGLAYYLGLILAPRFIF